MKKYLIAFVATALVTLAPALSFASFIPVGTSLTLDQLLSGQTLTVGDKLFNHFSYTKTGNMPAASAVTVQGIIDGSGNYGILFSGAFHDLFGGGASDALLKFAVSVLDPGKLITAVNLFGDPTVTGTGIASLTETWLPLSGSMNIFDNTAHTGTSSNSHLFSPYQSQIFVQKDILAFAARSGSTAGFTYIGQTFVQTPVPGSLVMLFGGVLSLLPAYRLGRRKA